MIRIMKKNPDGSERKHGIELPVVYRLLDFFEQADELNNKQRQAAVASVSTKGIHDADYWFLLIIWFFFLSLLLLVLCGTEHV